MIRVAPDGRSVLHVRGDELTLLSIAGATHKLPAFTEPLDAVCFAGEAWVAFSREQSVWLRRLALFGDIAGEDLPLPGPGRFSAARGSDTYALWSGADGACILSERCGEVDRRELPLVTRGAILIPDGRMVEVRDAELVITSPGGVLSRRSITDLAGRSLVAAAELLGCTVLALLLAGEGSPLILVVDPRRGEVKQRIAATAATSMECVPRLGQLIIGDGDQSLLVVDARFGRVLREWRAPARLLDFAVAADGTNLFFETCDGDVSWVPYRAVLTNERSKPQRLGVAPPLEDEHFEQQEPRVVLDSAPEDVDDDAEGAVRSDDDLERFAETELPDVDLEALGPRPPLRLATEEEAQRALTAQLAVIKSWVHRAIALSWDSGLLSHPKESDLPFQLQVEAVLTREGGRAPELVAAANDAVRAREAEWAIASQRASGRLPIDVLADELGLSPEARSILLICAAPRLVSDLALVYAVLRNDLARGSCDESLVAKVLGRDCDGALDTLRELDPGAPLIAHGVLRAEGAEQRPFATLTVDPLVLMRLRGVALPSRLEHTIALRRADRRLEDLSVPASVVRAVLSGIAVAPRDLPLRLVLRGRRGTGRKSLLAAIAERAGRRIATIDAESLAGPDKLSRLVADLRTVSLCGWVPCIEGLDHPSYSEPALRAQVRDVLARHPGPILAVTSPEGTAPFAPGHLRFELPLPSEGQRAELWRAALEANGLRAHHADRLAARHRVGAGTITRVVTQLAGVAERAQRDPRTLEVVADIEEIIRQHRDRRVAAIATRVARVATWAQAVLAPDVMDSLKEFVARIHARRTVFDRCGYDSVVTTARGLTALFQGGPGTGKTMVAGIIARELGYDLYRVDLSRVLSKWIGETEQNLAAVFDAAEEGQVLLLFDEADSLFSRRTEVRSSVDRYSNLETNYLLQRLDSFEGVAILTSNMSSSIDPAFKRRLSFRLTFPFPDEELREKLWRVHLPGGVPISGPLDLATLARRHQLSGGYIRNAALRAAFLAAHERTALSQEHLERAVTLEYRELGKLSQGGILE